MYLCIFKEFVMKLITTEGGFDKDKYWMNVVLKLIFGRINLKYVFYFFLNSEIYLLRSTKLSILI